MQMTIKNFPNACCVLKSSVMAIMETVARRKNMGTKSNQLPRTFDFGRVLVMLLCNLGNTGPTLGGLVASNIFCCLVRLAIRFSNAPKVAISSLSHFRPVPKSTPLAAQIALTHMPGWGGRAGPDGSHPLPPSAYSPGEEAEGENDSESRDRTYPQCHRYCRELEELDDATATRFFQMGRH